MVVFKMDVRFYSKWLIAKLEHVHFLKSGAASKKTTQFGLHSGRLTTLVVYIPEELIPWTFRVLFAAL
jgi:hypothetical protein